MGIIHILLCGCAIVFQSSVVIVAKRFLDFHHERSLSTIGMMVPVIWVIFTGLSFLSLMLAPSPLHGFFSLVLLAFLALLIYLDAASRCLPRCFTLAFGLTGAIFRFLVYQETVLLALITALSIFGVLWGLRTFTYHRDAHAQFGLGDVYLMAGLGMWFSFPTVLGIISGAAVSGGLFLLARRLRNPMLWQENVNYRSAPFAPFLCVVAAIKQIFICCI